MTKFDEDYWQERWENQATGWDIGYPSTPLISYFEDTRDRLSADSKILIPGSGNAYEGEVLLKMGFANTYLLDIAEMALDNVKKRFPEVPEDRLIHGDFFDHQGKYDCIVEQTFFCALDPSLREKYAQKMLELLKPGGILMGVLFDDKLFTDHPPFGGNKETYLPHFEGKFEILHFERCQNSIKPRAGRELFIELRKPAGV
ncbi:MAG: methyltransferase domain-containing protein [Cryomorphaceae bacterium]